MNSRLEALNRSSAEVVASWQSRVIDVMGAPGMPPEQTARALLRLISDVADGANSMLMRRSGAEWSVLMHHADQAKWCDEVRWMKRYGPLLDKVAGQKRMCVEEQEATAVYGIDNGGEEVEFAFVVDPAPPGLGGVLGRIVAVTANYIMNVEALVRSSRHGVLRDRAIDEFFDSMTDVYLVVEQGRISHVNAATAEFFAPFNPSGFAVEETIEVLSPAGNPIPLDVLVETGSPLPCIFRAKRTSRSWEHAVVVGKGLPSGLPGLKRNLILVRDVSREVSGAPLSRASMMHDVLSGCLNRQGFEESMKSVSSGYVLCVDLDHFRLINDAAGHVVGDALLCYVCKVIHECAGEEAVVARFGGDEFVIGLRTDQRKEARRIAAAILCGARKFEREKEGAAFLVTVSIGMAPIRSDLAHPLASARVCADRALVTAKRSGRNRIEEWEPGMAEDNQSLLAAYLLGRIPRKSIELTRQAIRHLQEERTGYEVCSRLHMPSGAVVLPSELFFVAEQYGLTQELDRQILSCALANFSSLVEGADYIALNVSALSINDSSFAGWIIETAIAAEVPVGRLCIEITETARAINAESAKAFICRLQAAGIGVALDDIGSGAASLALLSELPVTTVKLDGRYMRDVATAPEAQQIARSIVAIAEALRLTIVAEWIEDEGALHWVTQNGVHAAQGYAIGRPEVVIAAGAASAPRTGGGERPC